MFDGNREEQLRSEIESHIAAETELNIARGMSPDEARTAALRRFGNVTLSVEAARSIWVPRRLDELSQDLRYTLRTLRRNPAFSLSACAVIALSVGAAVPVFSFLNRVFLHALPYQQAERLVTVGIRAPLLDYDFFFANDYFYLRQAKTPFSQLTSWTGLPECDLTEERPLSLTCAQVESSFLSTLGVKPLLGRAFTGEEDRPEAPKVALLSYGFWQSRFGGDPDVLGRSLWVDGSPTQIIGVLPRDFEFPSLAPIDLLVPQALNMAAYRPNQTGRALHVIARLKPSSSEHRAFEQLQPFFRFELASVPPAFRKDIRPALQSLREYQVGSLAAAGWLLTAAITALLLITAANIGTLLLARGFSRQREFNVRFSLGAGWGRVASQVVTESVVLSVLGGAAGCVLAVLLIRVLRTLAPASIPHVNEVTLDLPALGFAFASSLAAGIVVGAIAVFALPKNRSLSVTAASREREGIPLRRALVAVQIAVSLVLVSLAGLLIESFEHLQQLTYGVQSEHVLIADISLGFKRYSNAVVRQEFLDRLLERLRVIPGTSGVAFSDTVPPSGFVHDRPLRNFIVNGRQVGTNGMGVMIAWRSVTPDYLRVLGIELLAGRNFSESDRASGEDLILLSRSLARVLFSGSNAVDSHLKVSPDSPIYRVVGIAADVRNSGTSSGQLPEYYLLRKKIVDPRMGRDANIMSRSLHFYDGQGSILVRTAGRPDLVAAAIRHELRELDPATPLTVSTLDSHIAELRRAPRFRMLLVSAFATLSLLLAATGLYGAITYLVTQRTREIGVRVAIGATPPQVATLVLGQALRWSLAGLIPGLLLSFAAAHWFRSLLFDTPAHDPKLFVVAVLVLLLATLAASTVPSIRASRLDAVEALRQD